MEGLWGTILCVFIVYPLAYYLPGDDHGSYEDPFNTIAMFVNSRTIQSAFIIFFFASFLYNLLSLLVIFLLNSVWHTILDNFRPITVWITALFFFYAITTSGDFGEPWMKWSWVQVSGTALLLYGTAVYNAPNAGSVRLEGQWYSLGLDYSGEYNEIEMVEKEQPDPMLEEEKKLQQTEPPKATKAIGGGMEIDQSNLLGVYIKNNPAAASSNSSYVGYFSHMIYGDNDPLLKRQQEDHLKKQLLKKKRDDRRQRESEELKRQKVLEPPPRTTLSGRL
jgi:hypothetical protein